jgi:hypothetical protein
VDDRLPDMTWDDLPDVTRAQYRRVFTDAWRRARMSEDESVLPIGWHSGDIVTPPEADEPLPVGQPVWRLMVALFGPK